MTNRLTRNLLHPLFKFSLQHRKAGMMLPYTLLLSFLAAIAPARAEITVLGIRPSMTDPEIRTFDSPHYIYVNREIIVDHKSDLPPARHQLLLWLPGTGGDAAGASAFCKTAANQGYHVISLMYPNSIPAANCRYDADPKAFENFRMTIIQGGQTEYITVGKAESIENRLIKLLIFLQPKRPREEWSQFLTQASDIKWETVAVAGQSQGGGHAALLAIKHCVARVICTGAPKDYSKRLDAPAAWYREDSATPKNRFFVFNHWQDPVGCTQTQLLRNFRILNLHSCGGPVDPAVEQPPYHHTRILMTSYPPVIIAEKKGLEVARTAHTSVIANKYADRWMNVWKYMLTESVE
ncbi:MAG: hypothetical protein PHR77_15435 [Kiritimatiellae bacterium]|nr:hypothetical protein [Kiritimatiellia bacterium]MDD5519650.1 hypothetical protein [Kiritimatiellia bacterium]